MRERYLGVLLVLGLVVLTGCMGETGNKPPQQRPLIPDHLQFASPFVGQLQEAGVTVKEVSDSLWSSFFEETERAAHIVTNMGALDLVVFHEGNGVEKIRVLDLGKSQQIYRYDVQGKQVKGGNSIVQATNPLYFATRAEFFVVTQSSDLAQAVQKAR